MRKKATVPSPLGAESVHRPEIREAGKQVRTVPHPASRRRKARRQHPRSGDPRRHMAQAGLNVRSGTRPREAFWTGRICASMGIGALTESDGGGKGYLWGGESNASGATGTDWPSTLRVRAVGGFSSSMNVLSMHLYIANSRAVTRTGMLFLFAFHTAFHILGNAQGEGIR